MSEKVFKQQEQRRRNAEQRKNLYLSGAHPTETPSHEPLNERYVTELSEVHRRITKQNNTNNEILALLQRLDERQNQIFGFLGLRVQLDAEEKEVMDLLKTQLRKADEEH